MIGTDDEGKNVLTLVASERSRIRGVRRQGVPLAFVKHLPNRELDRTVYRMLRDVDDVRGPKGLKQYNRRRHLAAKRRDWAYGRYKGISDFRRSGQRREIVLHPDDVMSGTLLGSRAKPGIIPRYIRRISVPKAPLEMMESVRVPFRERSRRILPQFLQR